MEDTAFDVGRLQEPDSIAALFNDGESATSQHPI